MVNPSVGRHTYCEKHSIKIRPLVLGLVSVCFTDVALMKNMVMSAGQHSIGCIIYPQLFVDSHSASSPVNHCPLSKTKEGQEAQVDGSQTGLKLSLQIRTQDCMNILKARVLQTSILSKPSCLSFHPLHKIAGTAWHDS